MIHVTILGALDGQDSVTECSFVNILINHEQVPCLMFVQPRIIDNNNINRQLGATTIIFINNFNQLNMFRPIISPILRSTILCLQLVI